VGFGTAGELDLTTGVSSVYLTIAERTGLLGLAAYLITMLAFFAAVIPALAASHRSAPAADSNTERAWSVLDSALLGCTAAILGALVLSVADHYYFNIEFPHMVALFWLAVALALASRRIFAEQFRGP
jgi:O-antigen ligase